MMCIDLVGDPPRILGVLQADEVGPHEAGELLHVRRLLDEHASGARDSIKRLGSHRRRHSGWRMSCKTPQA